MSKKTDYDTRMDFWLKVFIASVLFNIVIYIIIMNLKSSPIAIGILCTLLFIGLSVTIFATIRYNICNSKAKNMDCYDYVQNRFYEAGQDIKRWFQTRKNKKTYPPTTKKSIEDMTIDEILSDDPETEDELIEYLIMADLLNEDIEKL